LTTVSLSLVLIAVPALAQAPASLTVEAAKLENINGMVWFCLWAENQTEGFPRCDAGKHAAKLSAPANAPRVTFSNLSPGTYAVSMFHDQLGKGVPETNFVGMPTSPVGLSNNPAIGITSPPTFAKAKFNVAGPMRISIEARRVF
jgi:uncharacterized protein (DUF2141 family)